MNKPAPTADGALALVHSLARDLRVALDLIRAAQALTRAPAPTDFPRSGREARARHARVGAAAHGLGLDARAKAEADAALAEAERIVARILG
jgi:hypothetical protein